MFFCVCVFHSSFVYARGHYTSRYTFLFPFVYIKWYVCILSTFVSKWITFSRKDNLNVKVSLMFLYKIYVNVSFSERSYTHTHTHTHIYIGLFCPWDFPGENTGVGCHFLQQGLFLIQWLNPCPLHLLHWQADSLPLSHLDNPISDIFINKSHTFLQNWLLRHNL